MLWLRKEFENLRKENGAFWALLLMLVCLAFSIRFMVSLSTLFLVIFCVLSMRRKELLKNAFSDPLFICMAFLFLIQAAGLFYTSDVNKGWKEVTQKAGIIGIPFFFCAIGKLPRKSIRRLLSYFTGALLIVCLYCIVYALIRYYQGADASVFFYHDLVGHAGHHAVFFSFYLLFCFIYWVECLLENAIRKTEQGIIIVVLFCFLLFLFLLSSKLAIVSTVLYVFFSLFRFIRRGAARFFPAIGIFLILVLAIFALTDNPVRDRFSDLAGENGRLFEEGKFSQATYFNGLQFRLLTWRFTKEILSEKQAWALGVSPGDAQHLLNRKYREMDMYLGDEKENSGFLNFNCHNVYLQTVLESGIVSLLLLLVFIGLLFRRIYKQKNTRALYFFLSMVAFGFTESVLSSQYPILLFVFFPFLFLVEERKPATY
jgi:O-antigen ligase